MKANHGPEGRGITEFVTRQTRLICYAFPGGMTRFAIPYLFVRAAQGAGISGLVVEEKPHSQPCNGRQDYHRKDFFS